MLAHYHEYLYYYKGTQLKIFPYTLYNHFHTELTMTNKKRGHSNPNSIHTSEFDSNCTYPNSRHHLPPNTHGKISSHIHPSDGIQLSKGKI